MLYHPPSLHTLPQNLGQVVAPAAAVDLLLPVVQTADHQLQIDLLSDPQQLGQAVEGVVLVQPLTSRLAGGQFAQGEEIVLTGGVGLPGVTQDTVLRAPPSTP